LELKAQIAKGAYWTVVGQIGYMAISLITDIILAHLLTPFEFGEMAILMFFVLIANILLDSGFGSALIRKIDATNVDFSTVFVSNMVISSFCYLLLILFSGKIASYYKDPHLKELLIVIGSILIFNALCVTQNARLVKDMEFKKKALYQFFANFLASVTSLILAYFHWGIWALVAFQLLTALYYTIIIISCERVFFSLTFSKASFKELVGFGVNTTLTNVLATGFDNIFQLILGSYFSITITGFYYEAKRLQTVPFMVLNTVVQGVMFSSLARLQKDLSQFSAAYKRFVILLAVLMSIITCCLYIYADLIIYTLYGKKWDGAVIFIQLLSIASFFYFQELVNNTIFKVFNKTRKILYLEIVKKIIQIVSVVIGILYLSINVLFIGFIISSIIGYILNYYFSRKLIVGTGNSEFLVIIKILFVSVICVVLITYLIHLFSLSMYKSLIVLPVFILLYYVGMRLLRVADLIKELYSFIQLLSVRKSK